MNPSMRFLFLAGLAGTAIGLIATDPAPWLIVACTIELMIVAREMAVSFSEI